MNDKYRLCLVKDNWAWFTTKDVQEQRGEDWHKAYYFCNCGEPYPYVGSVVEKPYKLFKVAIDGPFNFPSGIDKGQHSVIEINAGKLPWIQVETNINGNPKFINIMAGTTYPEFVKLIHSVGGEVYEAVGQE